MCSSPLVCLTVHRCKLFLQIRLEHLIFVHTTLNRRIGCPTFHRTHTLLLLSSCSTFTSWCTVPRLLISSCFRYLILFRYLVLFPVSHLVDWSLLLPAVLIIHWRYIHVTSFHYSGILQRFRHIRSRILFVIVLKIDSTMRIMFPIFLSLCTVLGFV